MEAGARAARARKEAREPAAAPRRPPVRRRADRWTALRAAVWIAAAIPVGLLVFDASRGALGANPVETITHRTGWWALALLVVTLAVTPARRLTGWNRLIQLRRPLGLAGFFYATLHVLTYFGLDLFFDFGMMVEDVLVRPYITVGFLAWLLLIPLAVTSTQGWIRRLGKRWQRLHRLSYLAAALGVLHFYWLVKADKTEPLLFGAVLAVLLAFRFRRGTISPRRREDAKNP